MKIDLFRATSAVVCLGLLAGCGGGGSPSPGPSPSPTPLPTPPPPGRWVGVNPAPAPVQKKWTFLVYMNAANDLEPYSGLNINQMEQVGSNADLNVVVQVKRISNKYDPKFAEWKDNTTRRFYIDKDADTSDINSRLLEQNDAVDMGDDDMLKEFVQWGVANFPAERLCLVLWNHGAGWRTARLRSDTKRGVSYDDLTGSHIDTIELPGAIGLANNRKWDLLAWDSSLMQMAEVNYEVRDQARFIVGSEESPPGEGYPYDSFLARLVQNPNQDGRELGIAMAQDMLTAFGPTSDTTQSVLDTSKIAAIAPAVDALGKALLGATGPHGPAIAQVRDVLTENYAYEENRDLLHFAQLLASAAPGMTTPRVPDTAVQTAANNVQQAVRAALVININGTAHPNSQGLSIFLPSPASYRDIDQRQNNGFGQRYERLAFTRAAPNWQAFLVQGPP